MHLENLYLANFRNYAEAKVDFSKDINALVGDNGSGKTNLLDAIHFLSMTKSAFNPIDQQSIRHEQNFYSVLGTFMKSDKKAVVNNSLVLGKRKKITVDDNPIGKTTEIIGEFPTVLIAPNDQAIIQDGSETRRRFVDSIISQLNQSYLLDLMDYNKALKQRNSLLKLFSETNQIDKDQLEPYDQVILKLGKQICGVRKKFCEQFIEKIVKHYHYLVDGKEAIEMKYESHFLSQDYQSDYRNALRKDVILQRTRIGIHRDDFIFEMDGHLLRKFGSQGQQKSFVIALKLAQFDIITENKGFKPILLMDDIFDKLDDHRIEKLTQMIEQHEFGQVFITDARPERTFHFLEKLNIEWRAISVRSGTLEIV